MLKGFQVIKVTGSVSASTMTITNKYFKFNAATATELGNPKAISMLINAEEKKLAIVAAEEADEESTVPFHCEHMEEGKKAVVNVAFKAAHATARKLMGWEDNFSRRVTGLFIPEEKAIIYDLTKAEMVRKTGKEEE